MERAYRSRPSVAGHCIRGRGAPQHARGEIIVLEAFHGTGYDGGMSGNAMRELRKGRGAVTNRAGRYEAAARAAEDDGWGGLDEPLPPLATTVGVDSARTVIARNESPDLGFDRSINPYRGCEHGCAYCYARPSHAYLGLSPGQDFESRLFAKPDAAARLRAELARPGYRCAPIALGTNTDPYQPIERERRITRAILEVLAECNHPLTIVTKSALVARDIDILAPMAERRLARAAISVTTLDRRLANRLEPRASAPERRLAAIRALSAAGIPTRVMAAPIIPGLNDTELEAILRAAAAAGATEAAYVVLRLPGEVADLFEEWLAAHAPLMAARTMALVRGMHGGKRYDSRFHVRQRGTGAYADMIAQRFAAACRRFGLARRLEALDTSAFAPPPAPGAQPALF